jgi:GT2 family glycosyltransferase
MNPDDVTLVIPCYDVADTVGRTLSSVAALDPAPARVLCIDDGSTDGTRAVIESREGVELVEHEVNRGLGATLNDALDRVETPGFAKVDADVLVERDWLGRTCAAMAERDAAVVQCRFEEQVTTAADEWRDKHPSPDFPDEPRMNEPINGATVLCRTDALRDVGGWDDRFERAFDDIDLFLRLVDAGYRVYYTPSVVTTHIRTDTWREALRTAWAYHYDPRVGRGDPRQASDALLRLPGILESARQSIVSDFRRRDLDILWISLLRPFYHVTWDVQSVRRARR